MSTRTRTTQLIFDTIDKIVADGQLEFQPGHVADALRKTQSPMLSWEIRGEFSKLEAEGLISVDEASGSYHLAQAVVKVVKKAQKTAGNKG